MTSRPSAAQTPTVIQIDIENYAYYYADNPDYKQTLCRRRAGGCHQRIDADFLQLHRTGGHRPSERQHTARGTWSIRATFPTTNYTPTPQPRRARLSRTPRPQLLRGLGMGNPARRTERRSARSLATGMGFGHASAPGSPAGLSPTAASTMAITGGTGGVPGNARASRLLADYRDGTRCLGSRGSFDAKSFGRRDAQPSCSL